MGSSPLCHLPSTTYPRPKEQYHVHPLAVPHGGGCRRPVAAAPPPVRPVAADQPGDRIPAEKGEITVYPIEHASVVVQWNDKTVYVDPVGDAKRYAQFPGSPTWCS